MKGYITNHILYIFEDKAAEIPYVDESVEAIAIHPELLDAFKEANPTYADIMFSYNYQIIAANPKPFAGHTNDDIEVPAEPSAEPTAEPTPEPVSAGIEWDNYGNEVIVTIGADDNVYPSLVNPNNVSPIVYSSDPESVATINQLGEVTLVSAGTAYITALFEGDSTYVRTGTTYTLTVNAAQQ